MLLGRRRQWHPTPVLLLGKSHARSILVSYSPWGREESDTDWATALSTFHFHALEKEMATHSSVLAWRIPGMAEPGGLPSMRTHRVDQQQQYTIGVRVDTLNWSKKTSDSNKEACNWDQVFYYCCLHCLTNHQLNISSRKFWKFLSVLLLTF